MRPAFGDWRSLVAHFVRDEGVGGSNPLSPTNLEKPAYGLVFAFCGLKRMRTSGGRKVRLKRSERTLRQQRPAGQATKWRVILYHRPNSKSLLNEQAFLHLCPLELRPDKPRQRRIRQMCQPIVGCGVNALSNLHTTHFTAKFAPHISLSINGFVTYSIVFFYICLNLFLRYLWLALAFSAVRFNVRGINRSDNHHSIRFFSLSA